MFHSLKFAENLITAESNHSRHFATSCNSTIFYVLFCSIVATLL